MTEYSNRLRLFALNNLTIEAAVQRVEERLDIDLGHRPQDKAELDETYYPQFDERIRREAASMSASYRVFYCLENSIRLLIADIMQEKYGESWWNDKIADSIKSYVVATQKKERESGVSVRSQDPLDFTTFGQLGDIIKGNWVDFSDVFGDSKALDKVLATLNVLRGAIAHCKPLAEDEILRLHLSVRSWFRGMS